MNLSAAAAIALVVVIGTGLAANRRSQGQDQEKPGVTREVVNLNMESPKRPDKVVKTDEEWKSLLTPEQYRILRHADTERAFSCGLLENKGAGVYHCAGCDLPLFRSTGKFDSGTGWPSFTQPYDKNNVWYKTDKAFGMVRTEILCARCDGHLGHVFDDGPPPTGLRYCINGVALKFVPGEK